MNGTSLKVSIVLPTYNGAKYIKQSIDSCLSQTHSNIELVIVDDGSTDGTPQMVASYSDPRIRYIRHNSNEGLPRALNTGFANTEGEYLSWTSDDNAYLPNAIEEMVSFLLRNKDADVVYADYWIYNLETKKKQLVKRSDVFKLEKGNPLGACFLYSRLVYEYAGPFDSGHSLVEDYEYSIRIAKKFRAVHCPKPLLLYGEHLRSLTATKYYEIETHAIILRYEYDLISLFRGFLRMIFLSISAFQKFQIRNSFNVFRESLVFVFRAKSLRKTV